MGFGHEKLDVYPAVIEFIGWAFRLRRGKRGHRNTKGFDTDTDTDSDAEGKPLIYSKLR